MLKHLYINNFTIIDKLDIPLYPGFSVITGETGAGKSIILGAINLLLGQRADMRFMRDPAHKCVIEAHFDISRYGMQTFFNENSIDYDPDDCILRREISPSGKSRAFINDTPVPLTCMRTLGCLLIDIHSQHQNLLLNEENFQLSVVDIIASDNELLTKYRKKFIQYTEAKKKVQRMREEIAENKKNEDFIRFQLKELTDANLKSGMQEELEHESDILGHVEEIKATLYNVEEILGNEKGAITQLKEASRSLASISAIYPESETAAERIDCCYIELKDLLQEISSRATDIEFDPQRLESVNSTLDKIYSLEQKHGVTTIDDLLEIQAELSEKLGHIDNCDEELAELDANEHRLEEECKKLAAQITDVRIKAIKTIENKIPNTLASLGMTKARFIINIETKSLGIDGCDRITFTFSANTKSPLLPVTQVASGGEIARVMLSIKAMISGAVKLPTIIFDEIDTGVSGAIAEKMAAIMQDMAHAERQVISITHLPQIAAKGTTHYKVYKEETQNGTISRMRILESAERINEIAQMLSGSEITEAAVSNAKELLKS